MPTFVPRGWLCNECLKRHSTKERARVCEQKHHDVVIYIDTTTNDYTPVENRVCPLCGMGGELLDFIDTTPAVRFVCGTVQYVKDNEAELKNVFCVGECCKVIQKWQRRLKEQEDLKAYLNEEI